LFISFGSHCIVVFKFLIACLAIQFDSLLVEL
jgi:hypothetical protein